MGTLPKKVRTDVALDVHYDTLKEVKLFHGCDPGLLKELVIKLQPIIFLSGKGSFALRETLRDYVTLRT